MLDLNIHVKFLKDMRVQAPYYYFLLNAKLDVSHREACPKCKCLLPHNYTIHPVIFMVNFVI